MASINLKIFKFFFIYLILFIYKNNIFGMEDLNKSKNKMQLLTDVEILILPKETILNLSSKEIILYFMKKNKQYAEDYFTHQENEFKASWGIFNQGICEQSREYLDFLQFKKDYFNEEGWRTLPEFQFLLTSDQIPFLKEDHINALSEYISYFNEDQIKALTPIQISWLNEKSISYLTIEQISYLTIEQISYLEPTQIEFLKPKILKILSTKISNFLLNKVQDKINKIYDELYYNINNEEFIIHLDKEKILEKAIDKNALQSKIKPYCLDELGGAYYLSTSMYKIYNTNKNSLFLYKAYYKLYKYKFNNVSYYFIKNSNFKEIEKIIDNVQKLCKQYEEYLLILWEEFIKQCIYDDKDIELIKNFKINLIHIDIFINDTIKEKLKIKKNLEKNLIIETMNFVQDVQRTKKDQFNIIKKFEYNIIFKEELNTIDTKLNTIDNELNTIDTEDNYKQSLIKLFEMKETQREIYFLLEEIQEKNRHIEIFKHKNKLKNDPILKYIMSIIPLICSCIFKIKNLKYSNDFLNGNDVFCIIGIFIILAARSKYLSNKAFQTWYNEKLEDILKNAYSKYSFYYKYLFYDGGAAPLLVYNIDNIQTESIEADKEEIDSFITNLQSDSDLVKLFQKTYYLEKNNQLFYSENILFGSIWMSINLKFSIYCKNKNKDNLNTDKNRCFIIKKMLNNNSSQITDCYLKIKIENIAKAANQPL